MVRFRSRTIGATLAVGALVALPGVASAHPATAAETVAAHTDRADAALARATALFAGGKDSKAVAAFSRSRAETAAAVAEAAKLVRTAKTGAERAAAAKALRLVATQQAEQIPITVKLLAPAGPAAENAIAKAALADTTGRDKAIGVLNALLTKGMPDGAKAGIARAIVALFDGSPGRGEGRDRRGREPRGLSRGGDDAGEVDRRQPEGAGARRGHPGRPQGAAAFRRGGRHRPRDRGHRRRAEGRGDLP